MIEPAVGASTCASGSHVCSGHAGIFTRKPAASSQKTSGCELDRQTASRRSDDVEPPVDEDRDEQADEHERAAGERVEEELHRRMAPVARAPTRR